jgi:hypothetical protein
MGGEGIKVKYNTLNTDTCGACGGSEFTIGDSRVWCANEVCSSILSERVRVGLIEGRHPMPVDAWLLPANMSDSAGFHQGAYIAAREAAIEQVAKYGYFELYLTGLTVAALGAVDGMRMAGIAAPVCWNYDKASNSFIKVELATMVCE